MELATVIKNSDDFKKFLFDSQNNEQNTSIVRQKTKNFVIHNKGAAKRTVDVIEKILSTE